MGHGTCARKLLEGMFLLTSRVLERNLRPGFPGISRKRFDLKSTYLVTFQPCTYGFWADFVQTSEPQGLLFKILKTCFDNLQYVSGILPRTDAHFTRITTTYDHKMKSACEGEWRKNLFEMWNIYFNNFTTCRKMISVILHKTQQAVSQEYYDMKSEIHTFACLWIRYARTECVVSRCCRNLRVFCLVLPTGMINLPKFGAAASS